MPIASITAWLNDTNRSYKTGVLLYEQYGTNRVTRALIRSGSGSHHFTQLQKALLEVNKSSDLQPKQIVIGDYQAPPERPDSSRKKTPVDLPAEIAKIKDEKTLKYAQARRLFESIRVMDSQQHRLEAGLELLDLMDFVQESWEIIDEWADTGKIRELQVAEVGRVVSEMTIPELVKASDNLPPNISKDRKKLLTCTDPRKKLKISTRLQQREMQLEQIKTRLSNELI